MNLVLWGVFAYVGAQLVVGLLVSRKISTEADYLLGGRRFGYGLLVMTIFATWFGAETCIGASGEVYAHGLAGARMDPFGYTICLLLMGLFIAAPLWRKQYTTLADLFRDRFSPGVERLSVILLVPTSVMWAGAQIRAFGSVLSAASEMTLDIAIALSAAVVIIYTARGGMIADACTDFIQGIVLILGLLIISGYIGYEYASGNFTHLDSSRFNLAYAQEESPLAQMESWCIPIIGSLLSQELISRTLAARSPEVARNSALLAGLLYFCVGMIPVFLGLIGPAILPGLEIPEHFLPELAQHVVHALAERAEDAAEVVAGDLALRDRTVLLERSAGAGDHEQLRAGLGAPRERAGVGAQRHLVIRVDRELDVDVALLHAYGLHLPDPHGRDDHGRALREPRPVVQPRMVRGVAARREQQRRADRPSEVLHAALNTRPAPRLPHGRRR